MNTRRLLVGQGILFILVPHWLFSYSLQNWIQNDSCYLEFTVSVPQPAFPRKVSERLCQSGALAIGLHLSCFSLCGVTTNWEIKRVGMTLLAGDCGFYLGRGPLGFEYLLQWNFNYLQKVDLYQGEKWAALSHRIAINRDRRWGPVPPGREGN